MTTKTIIKIVIDVVMLVLVGLLMEKNVLGLTFHEVGGLVLGLIIVVHLTINGQWINRVTSKLFSNEIPLKSKLSYLINMLLTIDFIVILISGISISKVILSNLSFGGQFKTLHISASYIALVLLGVHLGLHWRMIITHIAKGLYKAKQFQINNWQIWTIRLVGLAIVAFGIYSIVDTQMVDKILFRQTSGADTYKAEPDVNVIGTLNTYLSIIFVFTWVTYYLEKYLMLSKRNMLKS